MACSEGVHWEEEEERRKLVERVQKLEVDKVFEGFTRM